MTPEQETRLISAIAAAFVGKCFDTTTVVCEARHDTALAAVIDATIPHCRYRSGYRRGDFRDLALRRVLKRLATKHFSTDDLGWWYIKPAKTVPTMTSPVFDAPLP